MMKNIVSCKIKNFLEEIQKDQAFISLNSKP